MTHLPFGRFPKKYVIAERQKGGVPKSVTNVTSRASCVGKKMGER